MFKQWKIKKLREQIEADQHWFNELAAGTEDVKFKVFDRAISVRDERSISIREAMATPEFMDEIYTLLLHRQFLGFLSERARQNTLKLMQLQGNAPSPFDKAAYSEAIERGVCQPQMDNLSDQLAKELEPELNLYDDELYG